MTSKSSAVLPEVGRRGIVACALHVCGCACQRAVPSSPPSFCCAPQARGCPAPMGGQLWVCGVQPLLAPGAFRSGFRGSP